MNSSPEYDEVDPVPEAEESRPTDAMPDESTIPFPTPVTGDEEVPVIVTFLPEVSSPRVIPVPARKVNVSVLEPAENEFVPSLIVLKESDALGADMVEEIFVPSIFIPVPASRLTSPVCD